MAATMMMPTTTRTRTTKMTTVTITMETALMMTAIMLVATTTMTAMVKMPAMGGRRKHGSSDLSPCEMHGSSPCRSPC